MEKHQFKTTIDAPREHVWNILWGEDTYPQWTSAFAEGSSVETDWQKGSKVLFLDGKGQGMVSIIDDLVPNEFMSFKHLGMYNNGVEDLESAKTKGWAGAMENYSLKEANGKTELIIDQDLDASDSAYLLAAWPKALERLKDMAEGQKSHETVGQSVRTQFE